MATHYGQVKAAWESGTPGALDREAEGLARRGVAEADIYAALEELLLTVRAAGADDETEERINGVMDRLTGWCHPSGHIRTTRGPVPDDPAAAGDLRQQE
ncbi:MAG: hypothetical protein C0501_20420 [Isosphaera sp.]|nr:hypothetical protein [Isosphaera sp.]